MNVTQAPEPSRIPGWSRRYATFLHAILFVLGFSAIFVVGWGGDSHFPSLYLVRPAIFSVAVRTSAGTSLRGIPERSRFWQRNDHPLGRLA